MKYFTLCFQCTCLLKVCKCFIITKTQAVRKCVCVCVCVCRTLTLSHTGSVRDVPDRCPLTDGHRAPSILTFTHFSTRGQAPHLGRVYPLPPGYPGAISLFRLLFKGRQHICLERRNRSNCPFLKRCMLPYWVS